MPALTTQLKLSAHLWFAACVVPALLVAASSTAPEKNSYTSALRFSVTETRDFTFDLGRDLVVTVTRAVDASGTQFGWDLSVRDRRLPSSPNFFYQCLCGHGPMPNDLYAWHFKSGTDTTRYPADRTLPVWGYPYTVRVVCENCEVAGDNYTSVRFVSGTVSLGWRRLPESNPRQMRISDVIKQRRRDP